MSELEHWTSEDATERERALLDAARRVSASAASRARIAGALGIGVGAGVVTTGASAGATSAGAAKTAFGGLSLFAKITVGVGVASLSASASWYASVVPRRTPVVHVAPPASEREPALTTSGAEPRLDPNPEPVIVRAVTSVATSTATVRVEATPRPPAEASLSPRASSAPEPASSSVLREARARSPANGGRSALDDELALLEGAQDALGRQQADAALATLAVYAERHPRGALATECAVLRIEALTQLGRADDAAREARAFVHGYPRSPSVARVISLLREIDAGE